MDELALALVLLAASAFLRDEPRTMALILSDVASAALLEVGALFLADLALALDLGLVLPAPDFLPLAVAVVAVVVVVVVVVVVLVLDVEPAPVVSTSTTTSPVELGSFVDSAVGEGWGLALALALDFFAPPAPKNEPRVLWLGGSSFPPFLDRPEAPAFFLAFLPLLSSSPSFLGVTVTVLASVEVEVELLADDVPDDVQDVAGCCGGADDTTAVAIGAVTEAAVFATPAVGSPATAAATGTGASSSTLTS